MASKAKLKAQHAIKAAKDVGKPRGKKSTVSGSSLQPIVIEDSPQA